MEPPLMLTPLLVDAALLLGGVLVYSLGMHLIVRVMVRLIRSEHIGLRVWHSLVVMAAVMLVTAAAHLTQIALWAAAYLLCGQAPTPEAAFYTSAQNYTALGYGDILLSERWRLLGPLEAINGLMFFGLSTAVLFAIMSQLIAHRLPAETGYRGEAAGDPSPLPAAGDARSRCPGSP